MHTQSYFYKLQCKKHSFQIWYNLLNIKKLFLKFYILLHFHIVKKY